MLDDTHHNIKPSRIVLFQLLPLGRRVGAVELDIDVAGVKIFGELGFNTLVGCNHDLRSTVELEELCKNQAWEDCVYSMCVCV